MGIRATLEHLLVSVYPPPSHANRRNAGRSERDPFFQARFGGRKFTLPSIPIVRSRRSSARTLPKFILSSSSSGSESPSPPSSATATALLDVAAERLEARYDINHVYHYLSSVESDLLQQTLFTTHERHPLHRIKRWTGSRFEPVELSLLGLRLQLGHPAGEKCPAPDVSVSGSIFILDLSGVHQVGIMFCSCENALPPYIQLLRQQWFPASCQELQTAATFRLLEHFHLLSSQANVSALAYYRMLLSVTDNTGVCPPANHLPAFLITIREWQVLKTLRRTGAAGRLVERPSDHCPTCSPRDLVDISEHVSAKPSLETPWTSSVLLHGENSDCPDGTPSDASCQPEEHGTHVHDLLLTEIARATFPIRRDSSGISRKHPFESWNWDEVTTLHAEQAVSQRRLYGDVYNALNDLLPRDCVDTWIKMVLRWEMDGAEGEDDFNPFEFRHSLLGQKKVRADLYEEDLRAIQSGQGKFVGGEQETISGVIAAGLDLEDQQIQLSAMVVGVRHQSSGLCEVGIVGEQGRLRQRIDAWHDTAQNLIPIIASLRADYANVAVTVSAQDLPLYLPSSLFSVEVPDVRLFQHEWRLREAQAYDALAYLRAHLEVLEFLRSCAYKNPGVEERANLVADVVRAKIRLDVCRYRVAHSALVTLAPVLGETMEEGYLQELEDADIRYLSTTKGICAPWIWHFGHTALLDRAYLLDLDVNKELNAALRVEWCDARAHARASMQMCKSLHDDMCRAIASHEQRAHWWETQVGSAFAASSDYREGADSFARRQASIRHSMKVHCCNLWASMMDCLSVGPYDVDDIPGVASRVGSRSYGEKGV
uniref:Chitin synthase (EC) n=1 Tax=Ganoderma boninense TaxID=34458 RepID=A0A5K1K7X8_9APHY|nr:Chitin synthase (EC [Ganoderma boninense]